MLLSDPGICQASATKCVRADDEQDTLFCATPGPSESFAKEKSFDDEKRSEICYKRHKLNLNLLFSYTTLTFYYQGIKFLSSKLSLNLYRLRLSDTNFGTTLSCLF